MSHIAVFLAEGFEEIEALTVVDVCRRAGIETDMVSVTESLGVTGGHNIKVYADMCYGDVDFEKLDMLVFPGGLNGTKGLEAHESLMGRLDEFYKKGKYAVGRCCAVYFRKNGRPAANQLEKINDAPSIFGHRGILRGRNACCYPSFEPHLDGAKVTEGPVEVSDHVVTSRGMGTAIDFGLKIVGIFEGEDAAEALAAQIVYAR